MSKIKLLVNFNRFYLIIIYMANKVIVPDIGDFENVEIIEILVKSGDKVKKNDSIVTLESDK